MAKNNIITGLDIGTSSVKALSAVPKPDSQDLEVLGCVQVPSFGVRRGVVVKVDEVVKNIVQALSQLQEEVGQKIEDVYTNIGGSHIFSTPSRGTVIVSRADQRISEEDVHRVIQAAQAFSLPSNQEILDIFPQEYIIDSQGQIKEPLDMQGLRLEVKVLALCAFSPYLKNLTSVVLNAGFQISDIIPSSLASSYAVLTPQQKELGVCLVDIGAGTTDLAIYEEGDLVHLAVFPIGSEHITHDLAVGLKTDIEIAEQIKKEFGSCILKGGNKKERVEAPGGQNDGEPLTFYHRLLVNIIEPRVSEIFGLVQKELKNVLLQKTLPAGIVLTGGGAKLPKIVELAKKELKLPVRIGLTRGMAGLAEDPIWSTVSGLVLSGRDLAGGEGRRGPITSRGPVGKFKKIFKIFLP
ncbi:MAG: cell division protein FtsA [Candidatus Nealsonbacteria bacterium CG09_land_8_20_14_0_10_42_14]|uniref:Cell division protein FtsA n=1 Tax=Candidatus Nealsonbacteria bacterium CG09_land_8_20_14_0_10_42_14 TaxID=1974707 RepID=A0A2H0WXV6_9BACT|nr:MAG: cell division protein FtsA [Candidatus Nealsonbacteria bacterium CG09_land_8_20_14_0_10_42_14]